MMSRTTIAVAGSAGACALAPTAPAATAAPEQAQDTGLVSVFHGIPGTTVDVHANGDEPLGDFQPGTVTDPRSLDAGTYDIEVFEAGRDPDSTPLAVHPGAGGTAATPNSSDRWRARAATPARSR